MNISNASDYFPLNNPRLVSKSEMSDTNYLLFIGESTKTNETIVDMIIIDIPNIEMCNNLYTTLMNDKLNSVTYDELSIIHDEISKHYKNIKFKFDVIIS